MAEYRIMEAARLSYDAYSAALHGETEHRQMGERSTVESESKPKAGSRAQERKTEKPDEVDPQHVQGDWENLNKDRRMRWVAAAKAAIVYYAMTKVIDPATVEDV